MAPGKSPAFQFYASDFLTGTFTMSLQEVGAYIRLLCYQWDKGPIPTDARDRARIMGCAKAQEVQLWKRLSPKFVVTDLEDGYINERLEEERRKQAEYRQRQSDKGKASAATRKQPDSNHGSTTAESRLQPEGNSSSSSSSSRSGIETGSSTTKHRGVGLIVGGGEYVRLLETHAYVGAKLRIPKVLHAELIAKSGANADVELREWYARLDEELEQDGKGTGDVFAWLRPRHQVFAKQKGWIDSVTDKPKFDGIEAAKERLRMAGRIK